MTRRNSGNDRNMSGWPFHKVGSFRSAPRGTHWMRFGVLAIILSMGGCGGKGKNASSNLKSVTIAPSSATVPLGSQFTFQATINLVDSTVDTTTTVSWEVNGTAGGNATVGTISQLPTNADVGVYQAPLTNPSQNITITAVVTQTNSTATTPPTATSNTATVTLGTGLGLQVTPTAATVPAGGRQQFTALLNSVQDPAATWSIGSASGNTDASVIGSIGPTGVYTAPASPPPAGTITVTAKDGSSTATATVTVVYSDVSLNGPYAFSYTGNDASGHLDAAGSFLADGQGHITGGVEDVDSFLNGVDQAAPISGTYSIGTDGRGKATITRGQTTEVWRFAVTTGLHAELILAGPNATGGGTIDQQSVGALTNSPSVITGPYVFRLLGADTSVKPLGMAGEFTAGGAGNIPSASGTLIDVNDNGTVSAADASLSGTYAFDASNPNSGRGTITLQSTSTSGSRQYAFYAVSTALDASNNTYVTQMHLIEIDSAGHVAGELFSAPAASALGSGNLSAGTYAFTYGGNSSSGAYAAGGIIASNGSGGATGGVLDINNAGTTTLNTPINSCTSSLDATLRRIALKCAAGSASPQFAVYQTSLGSAVMLEIDPAAVATGTAYLQCGPSSAGCAAASPAVGAKSLALGLVGQGVFGATPASFQQSIDGQISLASGAATPGSIDINNFTATFTGDPISAVSLGTASSLGRGTTTVTASAPSATYNLIYYLIGDRMALMLDQDKTFILRGQFAQQY
ncbi:MAG: hypothetical protein KGL75_04070 [Acidobacteriota bacterium]|nr:hypothetical protein [Acidobacteriota bacterium]